MRLLAKWRTWRAWRPSERVLDAVVLLIVLGSLFGSLGRAGIRDPHELGVIEKSRRIAVSLLGVDHLALAGAANEVPTLEELGRPQLPFTLMALGLSVFGLSDWAARLPLALCALVGVLALYGLVRRLADRAAARYTALVLATMPLFFIQARTALGDIVTLSSLALAAAGLGLAVFDERLKTTGRLCLASLGLGGLGLGFAGSGLPFGVVVPALGIGFAWLFARQSSRSQPWLAGDTLGLLSLAVGVVASGVSGWSWWAIRAKEYSMLLGASVDQTGKLLTHEFVVQQLAYALFPWSALAPVAIALGLSRLEWGASRASASGGNASNQPSRLLLLCLSITIVSYVADGLLLPEIGRASYGAAVPLAALIGFAASAWDGSRRHDNGADAERAYALFAAVGAALVVVLALDFRSSPNRGLAPFLLKDVQLPKQVSLDARFFVIGGLLVALALGGAMLAPQISALWQQLRRRSPTDSTAVIRTPAWLWAGPCAGVGLALSLAYYPALARAVSPRDALGDVRDLAGPGELLGALGGPGGGMHYHATEGVEHFSTPDTALDWFGAAGKPRWLAVKREDLARVNAAYRSRSRSEPSRNLPVRHVVSGDLFVAASSIDPNATNENPLARWLPDTKPIPAHPLDLNFGGNLEALGWQISDSSGKPVDVVTRGDEYEIAFFYEVLGPTTGKWKTFIHVEGHGKRFNVDHDTLAGEYPFQFWRRGDFIADRQPLNVASSYAPGTYTVYFGFFLGKKRWHVERGEHIEDRVRAGTFELQ